MNKFEPTANQVEMAQMLNNIGHVVRQLRSAQGLTLQALGKRANLSVSMLSLIERGKASPSIGTLMVLASIFGVDMTRLLGANDSNDREKIVSRNKSQRVVRTADGVTRQIAKTDLSRGLEIAINEYNPSTASSPRPVIHEGFEYGIVLRGRLKVMLDGKEYALSPGDLISYPSSYPHRIVNTSSKKARALWINLREKPRETN